MLVLLPADNINIDDSINIDAQKNKLKLLKTVMIVAIVENCEARKLLL
jgi:hypothetical protein